MNRVHSTKVSVVYVEKILARARNSNQAAAFRILEAMEFASMEVMRTVAQTCLVRCVLTAVELMELSAAVCVRVVNMTQKAVNEKLFTLPVVGKILASGNGLHGKIDSWCLDTGFRLCMNVFH